MILPNGIEVIRQEHHIYSNYRKVRDQIQADWERLRSDFKGSPDFDPTKCFMGRWHYWYIKGDKRISLVKTIRGFFPGKVWEICSDGTCKGCNDAEELFHTKKDAERRIFSLLLQPDSTEISISPE